MGVAQPTPLLHVRVAQPTPTFAFIVYIITQKWGSLKQTPKTCVSLRQPPLLLFIVYIITQVGGRSTNPAFFSGCSTNPAFAFIVYVITQKWGSLLRAPTPTDKPLFIFYC